MLILLFICYTGQKSDKSISRYLNRFPLVGSSKVNIVLEKNDLRGYHIKGVLHRDNAPNRRLGIELLFDAEGKFCIILFIIIIYKCTAVI